MNERVGALITELERQIQAAGFTVETYEACVKDIVNKIIYNEDVDWSEIAQKYNINISKETLRKAASPPLFGGAFVYEYFKQKATNTGKDDAQTAMDSYPKTIELNKDGSYTSTRLVQLSEIDAKDPALLLKAHGYDSAKWVLKSARSSLWNSQSKTEGIIELYASKITVEPKKREIDEITVNEWFDKLDRNYVLPKITPSYDYVNGDKCLLIDIADLHLNLQATMFSTGNEYNCDIAEKLFFYVIEDILGRTERYNFNKIIFCVGGDMLNGDNLSGSTTKGTPQDSDTLYFDACERLYAMTIKAIDILKQKAPVQVVYVSGNHDKLTGYKLAKYIEAWFRNDEYVTVDYSPLPRKYVKFGKTLFVFAHDGNVKTLPKLIADEARAYWSEIDTTEVFLQHLHSEQVLMEEYNMRIQRLPTISAQSNWTVEQGYGSKRQCKSFVFDMEDGLSDVLYTPIKNKSAHVKSAIVPQNGIEVTDSVAADVLIDTLVQKAQSKYNVTSNMNN